MKQKYLEYTGMEEGIRLNCLKQFYSEPLSYDSTTYRKPRDFPPTSLKVIDFLL